MNCATLVHPFQNDAGVSQKARAAAELLSAAPKIDGRTLADLLNYFQQLSSNVNFYQYDERTDKIVIGNWQPFFRNSMPFIFSSIIKYNLPTITRQLKKYHRMFSKHPSAKGLQLIIHYIYHKAIDPVNKWSMQLKDSEFQSRIVLEQLIKDKLTPPVKQFICLVNNAASDFHVKGVNFTKLTRNAYWQLAMSDLKDKDNCFITAETSRRKRLIALTKRIVDLAPVFFESIRVVTVSSGLDINASLEPAREELQKKHAPHLALLFAFIKLFGELQSDLNGFTLKHLDFFYREVLKLKARNANPDKAHILLEIQAQLENYKLDKGVKVKAGKDEKKAEMIYALQDEIVINKTKVAEVKTLFLNNKVVRNKSYVEGVYMAPDALKADGQKLEFMEEPKSWPTLGAKFSKFADPETKLLKQYPNGRIGFALASPVLLMREGTRTVDLTIVCELSSDLCKVLPSDADIQKKNCCEGKRLQINNIANQLQDSDVRYWESEMFFEKTAEELNKKFIIVTLDAVEEAVKKGLSQKVSGLLKEMLLGKQKQLCYCPIENYQQQVIRYEDEWNYFLETKVQLESDAVILKELFTPQTIFNVYLSGDKAWVKPTTLIGIYLFRLNNNRYCFRIRFTLSPEDSPVVNFDPAILGEELGTTKPVVKVELNDAIKMKMPVNAFSDNTNKDPKHCCLERPLTEEDFEVSFYHFFRNLIVVPSGSISQEIYNTGINVHVEGMKNFLVENDDSIQDPGGSIVVFGVRPKIGSSFYVGSGEVFSKNWQNIILHGDWKNHPKDLKEHYKFYNPINFEDGSLELNNLSFKVKAAVLENGEWKIDNSHQLFKNPPPPSPPNPEDPLWSNHIYIFPRSLFSGSSYTPGNAAPPDLAGRVSLARYGFLRLALEGMSFQHEYYAFELARQLMKLAEMVDPITMNDASQKVVFARAVTAQAKTRIADIAAAVVQVQAKISNSINLLFLDTNNPAADGLLPLANDLLAAINAADAALPGNVAGAQAQIGLAKVLIANILLRLGDITTPNTIAADINDIDGLMKQIDHLLNDTSFPFDQTASGAVELLNVLTLILDFIQDDLNVTDPDQVGLPKEPYTPTFKQLLLEYYAIAEIDDIELIHLYPYASTYKTEGIQQRPALFPTFCNEGYLFLGLENFIPGSNLTVLFKLAEATSDSEAPEQDVLWHYLDNNAWKPLRSGLEVLQDQTDDLTTSGIVKFALPQNMTKGNTVAPKKYHWIRASLPKNTTSVSETIGINTQAVTVMFMPTSQNDLLRLAKPLPAGTINRLEDPDPSIKLLSQPYDSFGGQVPEIQNNFYVRVAELLRHKGRAIQRWDYERLTLEKFPEVFKAKCITHSFGLNARQYINDFPMAPGYVIIAVIPNLEILIASKSFQPKLPVSILIKIEDYLKSRISPFVRLKVMNPRYEPVDFCVKIKLMAGRDPVFYKEVLVREIREFMAPWAIGNYQKLRFGQCINRSDVIQFLESRNYIDFIIDLKMSLQGNPPAPVYDVCPVTPRSILIAGDIDVCIPENACDEFDIRNPCTNKPVIIGMRRS